MSVYSGYRLKANGNRFELILYLNSSDTEFADMNSQFNQKKESYIKQAKQVASENFNDVKISAIKIMAGSLVVAAIAVTAPTESYAADNMLSYTVKSGDTLYKISNQIGVSVGEIRSINNITGDLIYPGQVIKYNDSNLYTVLKGETLWAIAKKFGVSVDLIKEINNLKSDLIYPGQTLILKETKKYTVQSGDTLWLISKRFGLSVSELKQNNGLTSDMIYPGQVLNITKTQQDNKNVYEWPQITHIVQPGDTVLGVANKFKVAGADIIKYNYMEPDEWLNAGQKIAISGYAPTVYTLVEGEYSSPQRVGKLVDWNTEGRFVVKRNDILTIVDVDTGKTFKVQMMGGYNHSDIEPLTVDDTNIMKGLYGNWDWTPRAVVIFKNGMNIAASLSGMPHSVDVIKSNGVSGHFDLYLLNSTSHGSSVSQAYLDQHSSMIMKAAGK